MPDGHLLVLALEADLLDKSAAKPLYGQRPLT